MTEENGATPASEPLVKEQHVVKKKKKKTKSSEARTEGGASKPKKKKKKKKSSVAKTEGSSSTTITKKKSSSSKSGGGSSKKKKKSSTKPSSDGGHSEKKPKKKSSTKPSSDGGLSEKKPKKKSSGAKAKGSSSSKKKSKKRSTDGKVEDGPSKKKSKKKTTKKSSERKEKKRNKEVEKIDKHVPEAKVNRSRYLGYPDTITNDSVETHLHDYPPDEERPGPPISKSPSSSKFLQKAYPDGLMTEAQYRRMNIFTVIALAIFTPIFFVSGFYIGREIPDRPVVPPTIPDELESGPLIGHTTHDSTTVWALAGDEKMSKLVFWPSGQPANTQVVEMPPNLAKNASLVTIDNLQASTLYVYEVQVEDEVYAEGVFKTAPLPETPTKFKYLLASCMDIRTYDIQSVWDIARMKEPDFALLPGDTVYLNDEDWTANDEILFDRVWFRNLQQRKETHFANFIKSVPTYGAWDDHDYGQSNQGRNQPGKENSLEAWKNLWANPFYGTEDVPGNFYSYVWGDVHFMVMDNRWYRSTSSGSQWGAAQNEWLYDELKTSKSTFKVIVTGSDVLEKGMSVDLDSLGEVITENLISGVLFNAGDIHRNEFKTQEDPYWPYKITQISSSGIAKEWRRPFAIIDVDTKLADPEIVVQFYGAKTSDTYTTWHNEPSLKCSDIVGEDRYKESVCTETIRLSDLSPGNIFI